jgi:hypothetical protein
VVVIRRAGIVLLILVLALVLGSPLAGAKKKHKKAKGWASTVTLTHLAAPQFAGVVGSKLDACRDSRVVTLYYTDPNTGQTQPLSVQRTDGHGRYQVDLTTPAYAGTYQAIVDERKIRAMKAPQICKGVSSSVSPI